MSKNKGWKMSLKRKNVSIFKNKYKKFNFYNITVIIIFYFNCYYSLCMHGVSVCVCVCFAWSIPEAETAASEGQNWTSLYFYKYVIKLKKWSWTYSFELAEKNAQLLHKVSVGIVIKCSGLLQHKITQKIKKHL